MKLKVIYKVAEFGDLIGKTYWQTRRILKNLNIPIHCARKHRKLFIYLSDIKELTPDLFQSILLREDGEGRDGTDLLHLAKRGRGRPKKALPLNLVNAIEAPPIDDPLEAPASISEIVSVPPDPPIPVKVNPYYKIRFSR